MADGILWQLATQGAQNAFAHGPDTFFAGVDRREQQDIKNNRKTILAQLSQNPNALNDPKSGISALIRTGDLTGATQLATASKMLQPETTDEIKEYNLDMTQRKAAGQEPVSFGQWKTALKLAGATKINNSVNTGENQYAKTLAESDAKDYLAQNQRGANAGNKLNTLGVMENLMKDPNFYSGFGGPTALRAKQALASLGVANPNVASSTEAFDALSKKFVLDLANGSLGTGFSNADRDFLVSQVANIQNTPAGNKQLIDIMRKVAQRDQLVAQKARDYANKNKGRYDTAGFNNELAPFAEQNPLFPAQATPTQNGGLAPGQSTTINGVTIKRVR